MAHDDYHLNKLKKKRALSLGKSRLYTTLSFEWLSDKHFARGETALWTAVITQALVDALSNMPTSDARRYKQEATRWLTESTYDFYMVCQLAGFDPDYVRLKAKRTLAAPKRWRADHGSSVRYLERKAWREKNGQTKSAEIIQLPQTKKKFI